MKNEGFLSDFQEILQRDEAVDAGMKLTELEEWDSLAIMTLMAYFKERLGLQIAFPAFQSCVTIQDILDLVGDRPA